MFFDALPMVSTVSFQVPGASCQALRWETALLLGSLGDHLSGSVTADGLHHEFQ